MSEKILDVIKKKVLVLDGAFGTYLELKAPGALKGPKYPGCMEYLSISCPDIVSSIHAEYFEAGSDAVETNTFGGNSLKLSLYGLADDVYEINLSSARLARDQADKYGSGGDKRYVFGTMGPTGKLPTSSDPSISGISYSELKKIFAYQAGALMDGGVDAVLVETGQDLIEMKAAVNGAKQAMAERSLCLPIMAHATLSNNGRMLLGAEVSAFMASMASLGVDIIGLNCSTGPDQMEDPLSFLSSFSPAAVSCVPNAGLPVEKDGVTVYPMSPVEMAGTIKKFAGSYRLNIVGGCCGTTPEHIKLIKESVAGIPVKDIPETCFYASSYKGRYIGENPAPLKVGERLNTQGSAKMRDFVENRSRENIVELGKLQERQGADILDLCVTLTSRRTEKEDMSFFTSALAESVQIPLMIDSTEPEVIEAALSHYPGTAFINSANLEDGGVKAKKIFELALEYGAFIVCLVIDEKGMASDLERKIEIAGRLYDIAVTSCGLSPRRLIFDLLTFTLATGEEDQKRSAVDTINAIRSLKKKYPEVLTILGISNVSFGLSSRARKALNMVFLDECVKAGLDLAIINPAEYNSSGDISDKVRTLAEDLIYARSANALTNLADHFSNETGSSGPAGEEIASADKKDIPVRERIIECVLARDTSGIMPLIEEALSAFSPGEIINGMLIEAMRIAGEKFETGEMVLPYVLQSAEVMNSAAAYLEKHMGKDETRRKGKIILATVEGDVHDIGKNLVKMIFSNNGFLVEDLGKQVPVNCIVDMVQEHKPDALGLSALLVSTSRHMKTCVEALYSSGIEIPVIIGGSPLSEEFALDISKMPDGAIYPGGVFYAKDAFSGLNIMRKISGSQEKEKIIREYRMAAENRNISNGAERSSVCPQPGRKIPKKAVISSQPPFYGPRAVNDFPIDPVFGYLDKKMLFGLSWGLPSDDRVLREKLEKEYTEVLAELKEEAVRKGWLDLKAVYGYFKCRTKKGKIEILDEKGDVIEIFDLAPGDGTGLIPFLEDQNILPVQAVTVGSQLTKAVEYLYSSEKGSRAFYLHGLGVNLAEALASYMHNKILTELSVEYDTSGRFSPGYPVWKDLADQKKIFRLLDVTARIGVELTADYQMVPEQSTTAIISLSPKAP